MVTSWDSVDRLKRQNYLLNKQFHRKVPRTSFHLNGQTIRFHAQTWKLEQTCAAYRKVLLSSFHLSGHTSGFQPKTQKLEPPCTA